MSHEKVGATDTKIQDRKQTGVNFSSDYMDEEEIAGLSGEVVTYHVEPLKKDPCANTDH